MARALTPGILQQDIGFNLLQAFGSNANGKTGIGTDEGSLLIPTYVGFLDDWDMISAGFLHSVGVLKGNLYTWGSNKEFRTGRFIDLGNTLVPTLVDGNPNFNWTSISASRFHSLGIRSGELFAWGSNLNGRTGVGTTSGFTQIPTKIGSFTNWDMVAAGENHSLGIRNGQLYTWGSNNFGSTGRGLTSGVTLEPTLITAFTDWDYVSASLNLSLAIRNGRLYSFGHDWRGRTAQGRGGSNQSTTTPTQVGTSTLWQKVSAGLRYGIGIRAGVLFVWGENDNGKTGLGTTSGTSTTPQPIGLTNCTKVAAGSDHSLVISNGNVFSCGSNWNGQIGRTGDETVFELIVSTQNSVYKRVSAGERFSLAVVE